MLKSSNFSWICCVFYGLMQLFPLEKSFAQVIPILGNPRSLPEDYWGMNGTNTINDGHGWNTINANFNDEYLKGLGVCNLRYPGGTVANYWDWREGYLMNRLPNAYTIPDELVGRRDNFYDPTHIWDDKPDNRLRQFKKSLMKMQGRPLFNLNMVTSDYNYQLAMLYHAMELNIPVRYIELGNEFYNNEENHIKRFTDVSSYVIEAVQWANYLKTDVSLSGLKIGLVGTNTPLKNSNAYNDLPGRRRLWLKSLLEQLIVQEQITGQVIDAISLHPYSGAGTSLFLNSCLVNTNDNFEYFTNNPSASICMLETMFNRPFVLMDVMIQQELDMISVAGKETWISEYNMFDTDEYYVHGTWAHGLFAASMTLSWLEYSNITKINLHTLLGNATFSGVFADADGFSGMGDFEPPNPAPSTTVWNYTAIGNAMSIIGPALARSNQIQKIDFTGIVDDLDPGAAIHPVLYGYKFIETGVDEELVLLNLGDGPITINLDDIDFEGTMPLFVDLMAGDPFLHVTENANNQCSGLLPNMLGQEALKLCQNYSVPANHQIDIPGYSILHVRVPFLTQHPFLTLSDDEICTTPEFLSGNCTSEESQISAVVNYPDEFNTYSLLIPGNPGIVINQDIYDPQCFLHEFSYWNSQYSHQYFHRTTGKWHHH